MNQLEVETGDCLEHCEGSIVDYYRLNNPLNNESYGMQQIMKDYKYYKLSAFENIPYPRWNVDGRVVDFKFTNKLKFVQISFSTSTFDRIQRVRIRSCHGDLLTSLQDRAAKLFDKLADIGGTMGLLTGFSFISAVEILYFMLKIMLKVLRERKIIKSSGAK